MNKKLIIVLLLMGNLNFAAEKPLEIEGFPQTNVPQYQPTDDSEEEVLPRAHKRGCWSRLKKGCVALVALGLWTGGCAWGITALANAGPHPRPCVSMDQTVTAGNCFGVQVQGCLTDAWSGRYFCPLNISMTAKDIIQLVPERKGRQYACVTTDDPVWQVKDCSELRCRKPMVVPELKALLEKWNDCP